MKINLDPLNYCFVLKPLLIGGKAMEYYGLREAGADIDFVVSQEDHANLVALYSDNVRDMYGDIGVCVHGFELWNSILLFPYGFLTAGAIEECEFWVVSLDRLLLLKSLAGSLPKNDRDIGMIVRKIHDIQYGKDRQFEADYFNRRKDW
ncbi:MAG TPA: hypothetical protein VFG19_06700 [Geobacteraceae bacterium]|nr:hypothetical protein [Geobacteraceae bacterium]